MQRDVGDSFRWILAAMSLIAACSGRNGPDSSSSMQHLPIVLEDTLVEGARVQVCPAEPSTIAITYSTRSEGSEVLHARVLRIHADGRVQSLQQRSWQTTPGDSWSVGVACAPKFISGYALLNQGVMTVEDTSLEVGANWHITLRCSAGIGSRVEHAYTNDGLWIARRGCSSECRFPSDGTMFRLVSSEGRPLIRERWCIGGARGDILTDLPEFHPSRGLLLRRSLNIRAVEVLDAEAGQLTVTGTLAEDVTSFGFVPGQRQLLVSRTGTRLLPSIPPAEGDISIISVGATLSERSLPSISRLLASIDEILPLGSGMILVRGLGTELSVAVGAPWVTVVVDAVSKEPSMLLPPAAEQNMAYRSDGSSIERVSVVSCGERTCFEAAAVQGVPVP